MLILFDIDDTLLKHSVAMNAAVTELWRGAGITVPHPEFFAAWTISQERHYPRYLRGEVSYQEQRRARVRETIDPTLTNEAADIVFANYFATYEAHWSLFGDALPCLERLSEHRLGVVSNGHGYEQRMKLVRTGISEMFEVILISDECGRSKPAAEIFLQACATVGEAPSNTLYIGDRYDLDAEGARRAGLCGVWLDRHGKQTVETLPPLIRSLDELPDMIGELDG
jgi:putative hydrolase of the HAD superfamily